MDTTTAGELKNHSLPASVLSINEQSKILGLLLEAEMRKERGLNMERVEG